LGTNAVTYCAPIEFLVARSQVAKGRSGDVLAYPRQIAGHRIASALYELVEALATLPETVEVQGAGVLG